jgi:hypothetical protein
MRNATHPPGRRDACPTRRLRTLRGCGDACPTRRLRTLRDCGDACPTRRLRTLRDCGAAVSAAGWAGRSSIQHLASSIQHLASSIGWVGGCAPTGRAAFSWLRRSRSSSWRQMGRRRQETLTCWRSSTADVRRFRLHTWDILRRRCRRQRAAGARSNCRTLCIGTRRWAPFGPWT